ncbi:OLC1v1026198C2 [Oldenlandia corymbosa var. corymbosa]|uniref:OLC1v1026198C2 n=1 Tax=Oldenlandia corymbosa var. corymbosa TaxID=529605 RepID=A0AAV1C8K0_OLDCO|nr:OLC1v1026198C2 [Oldenlandia corymbosa var. corymbosa]
MDHLSDDETTNPIDNAAAAVNSSSSGVGNAGGGGGGGGGGFHSIRDRFRFKRNPNSSAPYTTKAVLPQSSPSASSLPYDRQFKHGRSHHHHHHYSRSLPRRLLLFPFRERSWFYVCIFVVIFVFALASMVLQSSIMSVFRQGGGGSEWDKSRWSVRDDLKLGTSLHFVPSKRFELHGGLDQLRNQPRIGVRPPRLGLILGNMEKNPSSLMLTTVMKNLKGLGYLIKIYALQDGDARLIWEEIGGTVSNLSPEGYGGVDWSMFEGVIADSLEAKDAISSLMQEPFCSVPLIWIIEEDSLATRLKLYENNQWGHITSYWQNYFRRANVVIFHDYSLPMLYSVLDTGNFFVIPGSPIDVWAAEIYSKTHSRLILRNENGFDGGDLVVLVIGSSFFYDELPWEYAVSMQNLDPLLINYAGREEGQEAFKFVFLSGNSSLGYDDALQDVATHLGLHQGSLRHYGFDTDVNGLILMADIILYGSSQEEQSFPGLLIRAMSFGIPVVALETPSIKQYITDRVQGMIVAKHNSDAIIKAFRPLISEGKLSKFAHSIASAGRLLAKNMLASECVTTYARLIENILNFPSDVLLPGNISPLKKTSWEWKFFQNKLDMSANQHIDGVRITYSVVQNTEEEMSILIPSSDSENNSDLVGEGFPTNIDWNALRELEISEELESVEMAEIEERMEKEIGDWDELYRNARKSEKLKFETYERDEGELERTGQPVCIYEIYHGAGAWQFLHHGSLYRGLSLSTGARRLSSDDVDAVTRLPVLNDTYLRDILCEIGGMFSIANGIDNIHKRPWIGFQSWRATGRKATLSAKAEQVLEDVIQKNTKGDVIYFWGKLDVDGGFMGNNDVLTFWSMCDILNGGNCRTGFEDAFRRMYGLPPDVEALPPMPEDGGRWSTLHSWVMPTPSFVEFIMFSRIFADSLHHLHVSSSQMTSCLLGSSMLEKKHCYCRILELLVNVWAYHSSRKMVYIDPHSGLVEEQHPVEQRRGYMWTKYFNTSLLKSMDEDLAEAADDNDHPYENWLWPLTGEVYWQGIYEREREERYRLKMDKKRKVKEKLLERMKNGYRQKSLGRRK